ncbi:magnesium ion transporter [Cyanidiococcus yangmingshanensis]|uniref:Magnesium ion transporter n=1 Tax=Cyanidiococcus yangmingshanensis TaxID=2690220 RepID=A0A7J7ILQ7_9RHOD|nr:magnesium ion transporter [Cyanidiococcus yangmingshanensis]
MPHDKVSENSSNGGKAACPWCAYRHRNWLLNASETSTHQVIECVTNISDLSCPQASHGNCSAVPGQGDCILDHRLMSQSCGFVTNILDFIVIDRNGHQWARCWHRRELLKELQVRDAAERAHSSTVGAGDTTDPPEVPTYGENKALPLQTRDLRLLNPACRDEPAFLVRSHLVCVALDRHLFAIIQPGRLLVQRLFCPEAERIAYQLRGQVRKQLRCGGKPFEAIAAEALLAPSFEALEQRMASLEPALEHCLARMASCPNRRHLEQFRVLKRELAQVVSQAQRYHAALEHTLDDDLPWHIAEMSTEAESPLDAESTCNELELMIECGIQKLHGVARHADALSHRVGSLEQLIELKLSAAQLRLWSFDALVHLFTVSMFLMAIPSDFLGMSIWIPVYDETSIYWPWILATSLTLLAGFGLFGIGFWLLRRQGLLFGLFSKPTTFQASTSAAPRKCRCSSLALDRVLSPPADERANFRHVKIARAEAMIETLTRFSR